MEKVLVKWTPAFVNFINVLRARFLIQNFGKKYHKAEHN
jgi:hypothetical protein